MSEYPTDSVPGAASSAGTTDGSGVVVGLTQLAHQYLDQTRPWVRLMSVMAFVAAGVMVLVGVSMLLAALFGGFAARNAGGLGPLGSAIGVAMMALLYIVLAFVYIAPGVYLARYAGAIKLLRANGDAGALEDALKHQKSFWRFVGILTVVGVALAVVGMVLGFVVGWMLR